MQAAMDARAALNELEQLAKTLGVELMYDHITGDGARVGGLCKVKGRWRVIIERRSSPGERVFVLARSLARLTPSTVDVSEDVRTLLAAGSKKPQSKSGLLADEPSSPDTGHDGGGADETAAA